MGFGFDRTAPLAEAALPPPDFAAGRRFAGALPPEPPAAGIVKGSLHLGQRTRFPANASLALNPVPQLPHWALIGILFLSSRSLLEQRGPDQEIKRAMVNTHTK